QTFAAVRTGEGDHGSFPASVDRPGRRAHAVGSRTAACPGQRSKESQAIIAKGLALCKGITEPRGCERAGCATSPACPWPRRRSPGALPCQRQAALDLRPLLAVRQGPRPLREESAATFFPVC